MRHKHPACPNGSGLDSNIVAFVMQGPEASSHAHEAGYDAYMTGAAFACLMRLHEAAASSPGQPLPSLQQQPSLDAVQHLLGRINIGRSAAVQFPQ